MKILITGGAGYIGSFMINSLIKNGDDVFVIDDLKRGHRSAINKKASLIEADIRDTNTLDSFFAATPIEAILHFAGLISVEESTKNPDLYFDNNVNGSRNLFDTALKHGIRKFIFSSTAAVYGNPQTIPIPEDHPKNPTSPYGKTKLEIEKYLSSLRDKDYSVSFACLRYFNACGASLDGKLGENHNPETHIIPLAINAAISGSEFKLFGNDYNTPDGTCIRDYIHVLDLIESHFLALQLIIKNSGGFFYNVGTGIGSSNKEVIEMVMRISGLNIRVLNSPRRKGDADMLIADPTKIKKNLNFKPKYSDLETIVKTAWEWHKNQIKD